MRFPRITLLAVLAVAACADPAAIGAEAVCGVDRGEHARRALLADFNAARRLAGLDPVAPREALCDAARWRSASVAASGVIETDVGVLRETTRRLREGGYAAHRWIEGTLLAGSEGDVFEQWEKANPGWLDQAIKGDFEHVGVGLARFEGRPVYTLILALTSRTAEGRQAAPLKDLEHVRREALAAVNEAREEANRRPLVAHPVLDAAAQTHAEDMLRRSYYSHESPEGTTAADRVRAAGYRVRGPVAENIAKGIFSPDEVVRRWIDSPGHRENILLRKAREVGVGVAFGDNDNGFEVIWVQVFAGY